MSNFEVIGCNWLLERTTRKGMEISYARSCKRCAETGRKADCDHCAIKVCHDKLIELSENKSKLLAY